MDDHGVGQGLVLSDFSSRGRFHCSDLMRVQG